MERDGMQPLIKVFRFAYIYYDWYCGSVSSGKYEFLHGYGILWLIGETHD